MATTPRVPPVLILGGAFAAQEILSRRKRRRQEAEGGGKPKRFTRFLVGTKLGTSLGLIAAALVELRKAGTTLDPTSPERTTSLVTSGVFGRTRNPIYLGMAGILAANALRRRSVLGWLAVPGFMAAIGRCQIPAEEAAMAARFGAAWEAYRARVPRWIGVPRESETR